MRVHVNRCFTFLLTGLLTFGAAHAQTRADPSLIDSLRRGGHVLLMRHASSPRQAPTAETAKADNKDLERQLDPSGADAARAMGTALKALRIPIGEIHSSPTYRARETVRYAALGEPRITEELGDGGRSMQASGLERQSSWLRAKIVESPRAGTNTLLVTHQPNIVNALGREWSDVADGEMLVLRPQDSSFKIVARIRIDEWPQLAAGYGDQK